MPRAKKTSGARKRRAPVRRVMRLRRRNVQPENTAKISEVVEQSTITANVGYQFQLPGIIGDRARALAEQYGLYRVASVSFKYKPAADTFVSNAAFIGGAGAASVPYLFWKMNRYGDDPAVVTAANLRTLGAKAIRFDDKTVNHSYKPNILLGNVTTTGGVSGQVKMTPWLNTDDAPMTPTFVPSSTNHYGHWFIVECAMNGAGTTPVGDYEVTVHYEFKNPRTTWATSGPQKIMIGQPAEIVH